MQHSSFRLNFVQLPQINPGSYSPLMLDLGLCTKEWGSETQKRILHRGKNAVRKDKETNNFFCLDTWYVFLIQYYSKFIFLDQLSKRRPLEHFIRLVNYLYLNVKVWGFYKKKLLPYLPIILKNDLALFASDLMWLDKKRGEGIWHS